MSALETVPELADGGYWYVLTVVTVDGGQTPGDIPGAGWCAWYYGGLVAVRTPEPVAGVKTADPSDVDAVLQGAGFARKPFGRIGGS